jgi:hypothetical protein
MEGKEIQVDMYTEDKKLLRTAEHCKPCSPKKMNSYFCCGLADCMPLVKG